MKEFLRAIVWFVVTAAIAKKICGADLATTQLLTADGTVEIMRAQSSQWNPAKSGEALQINDRLRTGKKSRATLRLSDSSIVRLSESSTFQLAVPNAGP